MKCIALVLLVLGLANAVTACVQWRNNGASFPVGLYGPCSCISSPSGQLHLTFDAAGVLSLRDSLLADANVIWTANPDGALAPLLTVGNNGLIKVISELDVVWTSFPAGFVYPGAAVDSLWALDLSQEVLRVVHKGTAVVWTSSSGVVYAQRKSKVTELAENEYIQEVDRFLLAQIDSGLCVYIGQYPSIANKQSCIVDYLKKTGSN